MKTTMIIMIVKYEEDRPYTKKEIQTMLKTATDIRVIIIVLLISSSEIRMGQSTFKTS